MTMRQTRSLTTEDWKDNDGAFAVVDIDTLWVDTSGQEYRWLGRVCKVYAKVSEGWKITMHTGVLRY